MSTIQLEIDDTLLQQIGSRTVRTFIERQLSLLRLQYLGERISQEIRQAGIDHKRELAEAREDAWHEYKIKFLQKTAVQRD